MYTGCNNYQAKHPLRCHRKQNKEIPADFQGYLYLLWIVKNWSDCLPGKYCELLSTMRTEGICYKHTFSYKFVDPIYKQNEVLKYPFREVC